MKKKAIISTVASVMLAGVMCVGFAACANEAESMKGEEVTADQWAAAFKAENFKNVKIEFEEEYKVDVGDLGSSKESSKGEIVIADGKAYYKAHSEASGEALGEEADETEDVEQYEEQKAEGDIVIYTKNDAGDWAADGSAYTQAFSSVNRYISMASDFESYEYDADKKGYVQKNGGESDVGTRIYKFKDGKLAAIWAELDEEGEEMGIKMTVKGTYSVLFTYGGQSVTLPAIG